MVRSDAPSHQSPAGRRAPPIPGPAGSVFLPGKRRMPIAGPLFVLPQLFLPRPQDTAWTRSDESCTRCNRARACGRVGPGAGVVSMAQGQDLKGPCDHLRRPLLFPRMVHTGFSPNEPSSGEKVACFLTPASSGNDPEPMVCMSLLQFYTPQKVLTGEAAILSTENLPESF